VTGVTYRNGFMCRIVQSNVVSLKRDGSVGQQPQHGEKIVRAEHATIVRARRLQVKLATELFMR
jgi:hypothetical protein